MPRKPFQITFDIKRALRTAQAASAARGKSPPGWTVFSWPYVQAMTELTSLDQYYGTDSGHSIAAYLLSNLSGWRGPEAKALKAELQAVLDS